METRLKFWMLASGLLLCHSAVALNPQTALTQYTRTVWTQTDGLPQDTVRALTQTPDGYLWIGTNDGLARFDGYEFVTFTKENGSLPNNSVTALCAGKKHLWIGTSGGLARYSGGRFATFTAANGLPPGVIHALVEDRSGTLWIVSNGLLTTLKNGRFASYPMKALAPLESVLAAYEDGSGQLWVGGIGAVLKRTGDGFTPVLRAHDLGGNFVNAIAVDATGIWIGGNRGVLRLNFNGSLHHFGAAEGLPNLLIRTVWEDRAGSLWVGGNGGLSRLENGRFVSGMEQEKGDRGSVWSLFEDREGDLWVGMNNSLNRFRDNRFIIYGRSEGLPSDEPVVVHEDRNGQVWVGYHDEGLVVLGIGRHRQYTTRNGLPGNEIFGIRDAQQGGLLIATRGGLTWMRNGHFIRYAVPDPSGRTAVFDVLEDVRRTLWAATSSGVYRFDGNTWRSVVRGGAKRDDYVVTLLEMRDGSLWAGTLTSGLWCIRNPKGDMAPRLYTTRDGMGSNQIRSLSEGADGTLWIGTFGGGVTSWRDGIFHHYTERDGLLSDNISHIEDDHKGSLWLSTTRGICRIRIRQLRDFSAGKVRLLTPENYGIADGLRSTQCAPGFPASGGGTLSRDGRLWFPTGLGLAVLDPKVSSAQAPGGAATPITHIIETAVAGRVVDFSRAAQLKPGTGWIQFRYAGVYLSAPERILYSYKLEGLDPHWVSAGTRRVITYNPLPHGNYRFIVRAALPGRGSSQSEFRFTVLPYFYETGWFFLLSGGCVVAVAYGAYQLRLKQIQSRFSLVLEERARIAREIHDTLAQSFVGISSQLDALAIKLDGDLAIARRHLDLAQRMVRHSLTEARRSVMELRDPELEICDLPTALAALAQRWGEDTSVNVEVDGLQLPGKLSQDLQRNLLRIAQEAVGNALKHSKARNITVALSVVERAAQLRIYDDGRGFEPSGVLSMQEGHYGILGMRERAAKLGGKFTLASRPGSGTLVEVEVPLVARNTGID